MGDKRPVRRPGVSLETFRAAALDQWQGLIHRPWRASDAEHLHAFVAGCDLALLCGTDTERTLYSKSGFTRVVDGMEQAGSGVEARELWSQNNTLRGVFLGGALMTEYSRVHPMIAGLIDQVAGGGLQVEIARTFPLADAVGAHSFIESRQAFGRVVMVP